MSGTGVDLELEGIVNPTGMCSEEGHGHMSRVTRGVINEACTSHGPRASVGEACQSVLP
jgi:hypothetical protein